MKDEEEAGERKLNNPLISRYYRSRIFLAKIGLLDFKLPPAYSVPITGNRDIEKIFGKEYGEFPLYAFLLYSSFDQDIIQFTNDHASWLNQLSGESCLVAMIENPEKWGQRWKEYWQNHLGEGFQEKYDEWSKILPEDRDLAYNLADMFEIKKNLIPCIVFVKSFEEKQILCVPIVTNKDNYRYYFEDLFTVMQYVRNVPQEYRFDAFQKKWKIVWVKWILPEKIKDFNEAVKEWGSLIIETKNTIIGIIEPITPLLTPIKGMLAK